MTEQVRRSVRLIEIERLLGTGTQGWSASELAERVGVSTRTIQRDLAALESEANVPLISVGRRHRVMPGKGSLVPLRISLQEARALFVASRLLLRHADERDLAGISAMEKLASVLPDAIARQMLATAEQLKRRPARKATQEVLNCLTDGWAQSRAVAIKYRTAQDSTLRRTNVHTYIIEPSTTGAATYVIGFSTAHGAVRTFKIDRIQHADLTSEVFAPPDTSEIVERLSNSWGVVYGDDKFDVVVEFSPAVAERVAETNWHPSQRLEPLPGGGVRMELQLPSLMEFIPWVRSWGPEVRVIEPTELRDEVAATLRAAADAYERELALA